jgi:Phage stabilisation protein
MAGKNVAQFAGPSYHLDDRKAAVQSAVNCYLQAVGGDKQMMQSIPGEVLLRSFGAEGRGSREVNGRWFVVAGDSLFEVMEDGATNLRAFLLTSNGQVGMAHNATQLAIVDGPNLYIFNLATNVVSNVTVPGWRGSNDVSELDGYFIFVDPETDQFYLSAIDDGTALDALDFSSADASPDNIIAHITSHRQAWFFGDLTTEIWIDSGGLSFPFVRYQSYTLDVGIVGKRAVISAADTLFWVGKTRRGSGIVYMAAGNQPQRVSTLAVEEALRGSTDLSGVTMWAYQTDGHEFIGINAPGLSSTWVYDAAVQTWHEEAEWSAGWAPLQRRFITSVYGQQYGLDLFGNLVRLDSKVYSLSGRPLVRERTWPHVVQPSMEPVSYRGLQLGMTTGHGGNVTLQLSNDGGDSFGPMLARALGAVGRFMQIVRWNGLGTAVNRVFRIRCADEVPFAVHQAALDT